MTIAYEQWEIANARIRELETELAKIADVVEPHWRGAGAKLEAAWIIGWITEVATDYDKLKAERDQFAEQAAARDNRDADMQEIMRINNELLAERDAIRAKTIEECASSWRPIETAPKDDKWIAISYAGKADIIIAIARFVDRRTAATHWLPLPDPPDDSIRDALRALAQEIERLKTMLNEAHDKWEDAITKGAAFKEHIAALEAERDAIRDEAAISGKMCCLHAEEPDANGQKSMSGCMIDSVAPFLVSIAYPLREMCRHQVDEQAQVCRLCGINAEAIRALAQTEEAKPWQRVT
jgi:hypothetical protein